MICTFMNEKTLFGIPWGLWNMKVRPYAICKCICTSKVSIHLRFKWYFNHFIHTNSTTLMWCEPRKNERQDFNSFALIVVALMLKTDLKFKYKEKDIDLKNQCVDSFISKKTLFNLKNGPNWQQLVFQSDFLSQLGYHGFFSNG